MGYWVKHSEDNRLPYWLKSELPDKCVYCGEPMLNYYNDDYRCTNRKCSNESCYGFIAARGDFMRKILKIEGIGFAGCLRDARLVNAKSPFDLLKAWGAKPVVTLDQFLRMHCFEGIDSEWTKIIKAGNITSLDQLYEEYDGKWKSLLLENKDMIYRNMEYVQLKQIKNPTVKNRLVYTIMITGTPIGFDSKEHFINTINSICKGRIVVIHQETKRQSGVHFLIREPGSTTRGKVDAAKKGGIPIVTSEQFINFLVSKMNELNSEENN